MNSSFLFNYIGGFIISFIIAVFIVFIIRELLRLTYFYIWIKGIKSTIGKNKKDYKKMKYKWFDISDTLLELLLIKLKVLKGK